MKTKLNKEDELGKIQRYANLMQGDTKNAFRAVELLLIDNPKDSKVGSIRTHLQEIETLIGTIEELLKG